MKPTRPYIDYEDDESVLPLTGVRKAHRLARATMRQNTYNRNRKNKM